MRNQATAEQLESELRKEFEKAYQLKLQSFINIYNANLSTIKDSIHLVF